MKQLVHTSAVRLSRYEDDMKMKSAYSMKMQNVLYMEHRMI